MMHLLLLSDGRAIWEERDAVSLDSGVFLHVSNAPKQFDITVNAKPVRGKFMPLDGENRIVVHSGAHVWRAETLICKNGMLSVQSIIGTEHETADLLKTVDALRENLERMNKKIAALENDVHGHSLFEF